jgi:predicted transcriptional regulator
MTSHFTAPADPTRRFLLDRPFERDGRALIELEPGQGMTLFAVIKHLRLLEEADVLTAHKQGRQRLHLLDPVVPTP